jgi:hypothetical protein
MKTTDLTHPPSHHRGGLFGHPPGAAIPHGAPMTPGGPPTHDLLVLSQRPDLSPECFGRLVQVAAMG